jgi:subfamily B ATP-binding cassette protein MsbA
MTNDVNEVEASVIRSLNTLFQDPLSIIFYLATLLFMSVKLTLFVFVLLPITGGVISRIASKLRQKSAEAQSSMGVLLTQIEETLGGLRIIKAFNSEDRVKSKFYKENQHYTNVMIKMWRRKDLASPLSELLGTVTIVTIMWFGGKLILSGESHLTSQAFLGYLMVFYLIINPTKSFTSAFYSVQKGMASMDRINEVLDATDSIVQKSDAKDVHLFINKIEYKNLSFSYGADKVLQDINLTIEKGKMIALVGPSGGGKSTLVDLMPRFYDNQEGEILIDGVNVKDLKLKDLRGLFGIVNQESILFNDTIANNIAFGADSATDDDIIMAAKIANAHDFIMATPDGYQTNIGDRGSKLSGGQKQRLSIARAILKNPPILILDEATSALDTESERLVQDALGNLMKNRTSIVIAHRLSTVKNADEICVIQSGRIVERGRHDELLALDGVYSKLHKLQMFE